MGLVSGKPADQRIGWVRCSAGLLMLLCLWRTDIQAQPIRIDSIQTLDPYGRYQTHLPTDGTLTLAARDNFLTICCSAPTPTPIKYRLEPLDKRWRRGRSTDQLHYANLTGGTYLFQVRPAASKAPPTVLQIQIDTTFFMSMWFWPLVVLYVMGVIGVVGYLFLQYRHRQQLRALRVRDQIARDLHDDMGSYLSSISILSAALPPDPARAQQNLDRIGATARQVMEAMSDIVWSVNPAHDTMQQVLDRMKLVADELFSETDTEVRFEIGTGVESLTLPLERRRDFYLIYKEALTNAAKYAQARQVQVRMRLENSQLHLLVEDNGRGFDPANIPARTGGGNGLKNGPIRAAALGGTLQVQSAPGQGTRVALTIPA
jgi:signal transduction histidine kinase